MLTEHRVPGDEKLGHTTTCPTCRRSKRCVPTGTGQTWEHEHTGSSSCESDDRIAHLKLLYEGELAATWSKLNYTIQVQNTYDMCSAHSPHHECRLDENNSCTLRPCCGSKFGIGAHVCTTHKGYHYKRTKHQCYCGFTWDTEL
jgi:hypothetical protein